MGAGLALIIALATSAQPASGSETRKPTQLFSEDQPIRATIRGPISAVASTPAPARTARPATLELTVPAVEKHAIQLSPRGLTRRQKERCTFPPLRVEFTGKPDKSSLFDRQKRLKLTTHCRNSAGHQQHVLMEYAAYRMLNLLSPTGLRVRLGSFDYADMGGRVIEIADRLLRGGPRRRRRPQRPQGDPHEHANRGRATRLSRRCSGGPVRIYDRQHRLVDACRSAKRHLLP